jgi:Putative phage tail protein
MGGRSRSQTVGFRYRMAVLFGICYGPVDRVVRLIVGEREAWRGAVTSNGTAQVYASDLFGGDEKEGGIVGSATVMMGGAAQTLPAAVSDLLPAPAPAMRGILSVLFNGQISANNPYVKPFAWQVTRILAGWSGGSAWNPTRAAIPISSEAGDNDVLMLGNMEGGTIVDESTWQRPLTISAFTVTAPGLYGGYAANLTAGAAGGIISAGAIPEGLIAWTPDDDFTAEIALTVSQAENANFDVCEVRANGGNFVFRARISVNNDGTATFQCSLLTNPLPVEVPLQLTFDPRHHVLLDYHGDTHTLTVYYDGSPIVTDTLIGAVPAYTSITAMLVIEVDSAGSGSWPDGWIRVDGWRFTRNLRRRTSAFRPPNDPPYDDGRAALTIEAMNPAHIIYQCLTDTKWGMGYPTASIGASFTTAAQTLFDEGFGLCMIWNQQEEIGKFIAQVLDHCGGVLYSDPKTGLFELKLLRADYTAGSLPLYDETNIVELETFQRPGYGETVNEIVVNYRDVSTNKDASITVHNLANIQAQAGTVSSTRNYPGLPTAALAARVAQRDLIVASTPLAKARITVNREAWSEVPGGVVRLSWPKLGIATAVFRVLGVDYGALEDGRIGVELAEDVFGLPASSYVAQQPGTWQEPDNAPAAVTEAELVEAPYRSLVAEMSAADLSFLDADSAYMAALAREPNSAAQAFDLRARVGVAALEDVAVGTFVPNGTATGAVAKTAADTTIALSGTQGLTEILPDDLAVIGTGRDAEWLKVLSVNTITPAVTVARGVLDTTPKAHSSGARIFFDDGRSAFDPTERATSETVDYSLVTRTASGVLDLALAPIIGITAQQRQHRPYPPGNFRINGASYPTTSGATVALTWTHRDRLQQTAYVVEQGEASIGPEAGTTYTVEIYNVDTATVLHTETGISGTSYTPPVFPGDFTMRVRLWAVRGGLQSWQPQEHQFTYDGGEILPAAVSLLPGGVAGGVGGVTLAPAATFFTPTDATATGVTLTPAASLIAGAADGGGTTYRYWRLYMTANDGSIFWSLSRFKLMEGATDRALAYTATAASGSVDPVTNAFDDNLGTEWTNNTAPAAAWIAVDLGAAYTIDEYRISSQRVVTGRTPSAWVLQGSNSSISGPWFDVDSRTGETGFGIQETRAYTP